MKILVINGNDSLSNEVINHIKTCVDESVEILAVAAIQESMPIMHAPIVDYVHFEDIKPKSHVRPYKYHR